MGGATETPKNHEVVRVVPGVLDIDVLEQTALCYQKVFCPVPHLPPLTEHDPHTTVPHPLFEAREEVQGNVLHHGNHNSHQDIFSKVSPIHFRQVGVELPGNQQRCPVGVLTDGCNDAFDGNRLVGGQVETKNEPVPSYQLHLENQHIRPVLL